MKVTLRWPRDNADYLTPEVLAELEGQPTRVMTQDDGGETVLWDAVVVAALRVADGDARGVLIQVELLDVAEAAASEVLS
jgi:hypothetical protein